MWFVSLSIQADEVNAVVVTPQSGNAVTIALAERPAVTFTETTVLVKGDSTSLEYPIDGKATFTFKYLAELSDILNPTASGATFVVNDGLAIYGLRGGETVRVFDLAGRAVAVHKASDTGCVKVDFGSRHGVFIVKTAAKSVKIKL